MKELACGDAGFDCNAVVKGETLEDVMAQVRPHAKEAHDTEVTPEMEQQLAGLVKDV